MREFRTAQGTADHTLVVQCQVAGHSAVGAEHAGAGMTEVGDQAIGINAECKQAAVAVGSGRPGIIDRLLQVLPVRVIVQCPGHITEDDTVHVGILCCIRLTAVYPGSGING